MCQRLTCNAPVRCHNDVQARVRPASSPVVCAACHAQKPCKIVSDCFPLSCCRAASALFRRARHWKLPAGRPCLPMTLLPAMSLQQLQLLFRRAADAVLALCCDGCGVSVMWMEASPFGLSAMRPGVMTSPSYLFAALHQRSIITSSTALLWCTGALHRDTISHLARNPTICVPRPVTCVPRSARLWMQARQLPQVCSPLPGMRTTRRSPSPLRASVLPPAIPLVLVAALLQTHLASAQEMTTWSACGAPALTVENVVVSPDPP